MSANGVLERLLDESKQLAESLRNVTGDATANTGLFTLDEASAELDRLRAIEEAAKQFLLVEDRAASDDDYARAIDQLRWAIQEDK